MFLAKDEDESDEESDDETPAKSASENSEQGAQVIALDAFRKK